MTKKELVAAIAKETALTQKDCAAVIDALVAKIGDELAAGGSIKVPDLGTFKVSARAARKGINPVTKEEIEIPASKAPSFKAAKALKDRV